MKRFNSANSLEPFVSKVQLLQQVNPYEKRSNGGNDINDQYTIPPNHIAQESMINLSSKLMNTNIYSPKSQFKRQMMIYNCKFDVKAKSPNPAGSPSRPSCSTPTEWTSGDITVTERSPTYQIQNNQCGRFVHKFGANILQHPRSVTVTVKPARTQQQHQVAIHGTISLPSGRSRILN